VPVAEWKNAEEKSLEPRDAKWPIDKRMCWPWQLVGTKCSSSS
jgi:hypothetical protein